MKRILCGACLLFILANHALADETNTATVETDTVSVEVLAKTNASWNGQPLPDYLEDTPEITVLRITIPPGTQLPTHKHPVINAGVLLSGELTVVTEDNDILYLKTGDAIVEVVDKWHYGINEGENPAEIIVFYAGVENAPITIDYNQ